MPYTTNRQLPPVLRKQLPEHAQDIYREAFNSAFAANAGEAERDRRSQMIAWATVKLSYVKEGDKWVPRDTPASVAH